MKLNKDMLMKIGIVAAIAIIVFLIYRSKGCKDSYGDYEEEGYAEYVPEDEYAENMYEDDEADYGDVQDDYYEEEYDQPETENYTLMESTLDDEEANAAFEPDM